MTRRLWADYIRQALRNLGGKASLDACMRSWSESILGLLPKIGIRRFDARWRLIRRTRNRSGPRTMICFTPFMDSVWACGDYGNTDK